MPYARFACCACSGAHPTDVRMTTRFKKEDVTEGITGAIHETGDPPLDLIQGQISSHSIHVNTLFLSPCSCSPCLMVLYTLWLPCAAVQAVPRSAMGQSWCFLAH